MKNAYESEEHFGKDGKCLMRKRSIGGIVVWAIVVLVAIVASHKLNLSPILWSSLSLK